MKSAIRIIFWVNPDILRPEAISRANDRCNITNSRFLPYTYKKMKPKIFAIASSYLLFFHQDGSDDQTLTSYKLNFFNFQRLRFFITFYRKAFERRCRISRPSILINLYADNIFLAWRKPSNCAFDFNIVCFFNNIFRCIQ
jgi:hypothetical protein